MSWPGHLVAIVIRFLAIRALDVFATILIVASAFAASLVSEVGEMTDEPRWEPSVLREARDIVERAEMGNIPT
jgi:hypothetical protein